MLRGEGKQIQEEMGGGSKRIASLDNCTMYKALCSLNTIAFQKHAVVMHSYRPHIADGNKYRM